MSKAERYLDNWLRHRNVLVELLDKVEEGNAGFKPWAGARSLGELALHIATAGQMWVDGVQSGEIRPPAREQALSMAEVRRILGEYTGRTAHAMAALTDAQIEGEVNGTQLLGFNAPGGVWLSVMKDHEIHHKGQLFVYARMVGVKDPPFFVQRVAQRPSRGD